MLPAQFKIFIQTQNEEQLQILLKKQYPEQLLTLLNNQNPDRLKEFLLDQRAEQLQTLLLNQNPNKVARFRLARSISDNSSETNSRSTSFIPNKRKCI